MHKRIGFDIVLLKSIHNLSNKQITSRKRKKNEVQIHVQFGNSLLLYVVTCTMFELFMPITSFMTIFDLKPSCDT